ncbi:hypothetical protein G5I_04993 [Acromyrmex echinatior]|uniref:Uncharacterized protein n=1 Tax=Acromyrmex echinatior TaxID=103372 RepID=F4WH40_ACREC|nr:hypothetical protein G5I_04993 [Acromyrmex echinatior]
METKFMTKPCQNSIVLFHEFYTYSNGPDQSIQKPCQFVIFESTHDGFQSNLFKFIQNFTTVAKLSLLNSTEFSMPNHVLLRTDKFSGNFLSRDTAAFHVYKTHDKITISIGGINTIRRRVLAKHAMNAEQGLNPIRKKTKSIVSSPSPLFYAKSRLKLTQKYALTASSSGTQVVLYLERFQETGRRDELL